MSWRGFAPSLIVLWISACLVQGTCNAQQSLNQLPGHLSNYANTAGAVATSSIDSIVISCDYFTEQTSDTVDISDRLNATNANRSASNNVPPTGTEQIFVLQGRCLILQGKSKLTAGQMVIWKSIEQRPAGIIEHLIVYATDDARLAGSHHNTDSVFIELVTSGGITTEVRFSPADQEANSTQVSNLHMQAEQARRELTNNSVQSIEHEPSRSQLPQIDPTLDFDSLHTPPKKLTRRHISVSPRSIGIGFNVTTTLSEDRTPAEQITVIDQGVNIVIEGIAPVNGVPVGVLDLSADHVVIWTQADSEGNFKLEMFQDSNAPLQIYLEGNIEIRQGDIVIKASRAYYDIRENRGILLDSELRLHVPSLGGDIRLRASRIRQLSPESFHAENAWVSASEFGVPTYRIESDDVFLENRYDRGWLGKGDTTIDPQTGLYVPKATPWITSLNNRVRIGETTVFVSPFLSGAASEHHIPLENLTLGQDRILGGQVKSRWDMTKLLSLDTPTDLNWKMDANVYTERGVWLGNSVDYIGVEPLGLPGSFFGESEAVWINDYGTDNLGLDRRSLDVSSNTRGRVLWRHRQQFTNSLSLTGEIGFLSDRNFLEGFFEDEWDQGKDNESLLRLDYQQDNVAASVMTRAQLNEFEYDTQWLPKADMIILGETFLGDRLVYSSRSSAGYGQLKPAVAPDDPNDLFVPLWYTPRAEGGVFSSRHELAAPFNLGPLKINPYILGEAAFWQDDGFTNNSLQRYFGSTGIEANLMLSKIFPDIHSRILNLNGLAHKHVLGLEYYYAESSQDLSDVPQYNEFDENAQERFRTRLMFNSFGLMDSTLLPGQFDPRVFAVRSGAARNVSSPYFELVDDQQVVRATWNHRLQTKVGPPDRQRIKDWMRLDLGLSYFPDADDDNFGESLGLLTSNYVWNVGSRTKILANGQFDFFDNAPKLWDVGVLSQRSTRGSLYFGYRQLQGGPINSKLLTASTSYAMSPKWIATFGTAYDIAEMQDRGQSLTITGIRSDFMISLGFSLDSSKGNVGIGFMIEPFLGPRDASSSQLSSLLRTEQQ